MSASYIVPLIGVLLMAVGVVGVGIAAWHSHRRSSRLDFIRALGRDAEVYAESVRDARTSGNPPRQPDLRAGDRRPSGLVVEAISLQSDRQRARRPS